MVHVLSRTIVHQGSVSWRYAGFMASPTDSIDTVINNLRSLMRETGLNKPKLAKKSGVSERMIAYILSKERMPTIEVLEGLAKAFGLKGSWQLTIPGIRIDPADSGKIDALIKHYAESSEEGRAHIDHVAEREAKYTGKK